ncbi:hypothetical protein [Frankia gtarii]|uniref:hypothetical protein n=1 Tax=Frankia gtarii TaxID=2950102 RepID=UPI0021C18A37|nr:hypothetical protein [Frankia gtarii]
MTGPGLDRESIIGLLRELNDELGRRGAKADLFLVGGAALALVYDATRSTRHLDAVFLPTGVVRAAAAALAERHALSADWLNDAVKGFLPGPDPAATRYFEADHLTVDEGLDLVQSVYSDRPIDAKAQFLLEEIVWPVGLRIVPVGRVRAGGIWPIDRPGRPATRSPDRLTSHAISRPALPADRSVGGQGADLRSRSKRPDGSDHVPDRAGPADDAVAGAVRS